MSLVSLDCPLVGPLSARLACGIASAACTGRWHLRPSGCWKRCSGCSITAAWSRCASSACPTPSIGRSPRSRSLRSSASMPPTSSAWCATARHGDGCASTDVAGAQAADRLTIVAGDAFASVPGDCDTYLFVNVIHDWGDEDAVRLLRRTADDAPANARVLIVEGERRRSPADDITARTDLLMLALAPGGRERTTEEMSELARRAGLRRRRSVRLASTDLVHVLTR